ncbi:MAG: hypothetical protein SynsKO_14360 [Synoicihabitans sp.]
MAFVVLFLVPNLVSAGIYSGPITDAAFNQLLSDVDAKRQELAAKIAAARSAGINTEYAEVTVVTIDLFRESFALWDRANPAAVTAAYNAKFFSRFDPVGAAGLPFDELADCIEIADTAMVELQRQVDGEIVLASSPDFATGEVTLDGIHFRHRGKRVFPSKFFWEPFDEDVMQAFGRMGEGYLAVQQLRADEAAASGVSIQPWQQTNLETSMGAQSAANRVPQQYFLGHIVPEGHWTKSAYPDAFEHGTRLFTDYDIDHPVVRTWLDVLFEEQLKPAVAASGASERIHMLANEPTFSLRSGGEDSSEGVSAFTLDKYGAWLEAKYGDIATLNVVYGTSHASFEAVKSAYPIPLRESLQGGPVWYDWCRFNMDRVNDWFAYLHEGVKEVDPDGLTHVKLMGERSMHTRYHDEGLDFEAVAKLVDMPGSDSQMTSFRSEWDRRIQPDWRQHYTMEWRAQSIMMDFVRSVAPGKPFYDSEWHGLSGARWRDFHMESDYVRAALWVTMLEGMGAMNVWVWNRREDGSIDVRADFVGTSVTQPIQLDAFGRTMKELNAHGESVASLVHRDRSYLVYYSKDAAIQDPTYTAEMADVYEALKLSNVPVGFSTPSLLANVDTATQTVIVPPTAYISDADLAGLQAFVGRGGSIVLVDAEDNFQRNEMGAVRTGAVGFTPMATVTLEEPFAMAATFESVLVHRRPTMPVEVTIRDTADNTAYGVMCRMTRDETAGTTTLALVNLSKDPRRVSLQIPGFTAVYRNLISGNVGGNAYEMAPYDVLLLRSENLVETGGAFWRDPVLTGDGNVTLNWDSSQAVSEGGEIQRASAVGGPWATLPNSENADGSFTDFQVQRGGDHWYRLPQMVDGIVSWSRALNVNVPGHGAQPTRLSNVSCRLDVGSGETVIPGFVLAGSGSAQILVRVAGPALADFGVTSTMPNPTMTLYEDGIAVATNDDWVTEDITAAAMQSGAFAFPAGSADAALLATVQPGRSYTVHVRGQAENGHDGAGIALIEVYVVPGSAPNCWLSNASILAQSRPAERALILGFVLAGSTQRELLLRGAGPALVDFGVDDFLPDPQVTIYDSGDIPILAADNWRSDVGLRELFGTIGAFQLDASSPDSALFTSLRPGSYTMHLADSDERTGRAILEIYLAP